MRLIQHKHSDHIVGIWYADETQTLRVSFPNGQYEYQNVSPSFVARIEAETDSVGRLIREITSDKLSYPCTCVG
jgi:metal-dependent hydrolase (beta-lactamase superfamily II)